MQAGPGSETRRRTVRHWLCGMMLAAAFGLAAAPGMARDTLTIGLSQFPGTLHPSIDAMAAKSYILGMTRRPFTTFDQDWDLVCLLCETLPTFEDGVVRETREDGSLGLAVTFRVPEAAVWADGTPITTEDVVFTWEVGRHPQTGVSNFELYRRISEIDVHDSHSFTLHLDRPSCEPAAINDFHLLPAHLEREIFEADPGQYRQRTLFDTDPTNPGLYFGPYVLAQHVSGSHVVLERNPYWWGQEPAFRRIVVRGIENTAALEANLLSGSIDYIAGELGMSLDQAIAFDRRHGSRFDVHYQPGLFYEHIALNLDNPILADVRVRRALLHGIDRDALNAQLFDDRQPVAHVFAHPLDAIYNPQVPTYAHDPEAAVALLEEAGWTEIRDGIRHNAAGERLSLEFMTTAGSRIRELVQQVLQSQWAGIGVAAQIRNQPPRVMFGDSMRERAYGGMVMFAFLSAPRNIPRTTLHSSMIPSPDNAYAGQNYTGFRDERADAVIDALEIECEPERNTELWHEIQQIYAEHLPSLPLYYRADSYIMPTWLGGIAPTGHQYPTTYWVENWFVRP